MSKLIIKSRFATVPNSLLYNPEISLKAKGLYGYIQAKPDNWDFSAQRIALECLEGVDSIRRTLQELERFGYLNRIKHQNDKGHWEIDYELLEIPTTENPTLQNPTQENPTNGKPINNIKQDYTKKELINKEQEYNNSTKVETVVKIDFKSLLEVIRNTTKRNFTIINDKVKAKYNARLKDGYTKENILNAIKNASKSDFHLNNNFQYLTPEFFSRQETLDKYGTKTNTANKSQTTKISGAWDS